MAAAPVSAINGDPRIWGSKGTHKPGLQGSSQTRCPPESPLTMVSGLSPRVPAVPAHRRFARPAHALAWAALHRLRPRIGSSGTDGKIT